jgi:uncharacterized protein (DUF1684 family)
MLDDDYRREIDAFRREHEASLTAEDGWLTQVALVWLEGGSAELEVGRFERTGADIRFVALEGLDVRCKGEPSRDLVMHMNADDSSDVLELGSRRYQVVKRGGEFAVRVRDTEAPARRRFRGLEWYPIDPAWRIDAELHRAGAERVKMSFTAGQEEDAEIPGVVWFAMAGRQQRLVPYARSDGSLLFVFRDDTNADATYELCRYFYAAPPDSDDRVVLDFNRAAAPICAFVPFVTCVLPPRENTLHLRVEAGERRYTE